MSERSLTDRTIVGLLWMFSGAAGQAFVQLFVVVALARLLTPFQFGIVGAAAPVIGFSRIFSQFGVGPAVVQTHLLTRHTIAVAFTLSVGSSLVVAAMTFLSAPLFAAFFRMPELRTVVEALSLLFPIQGISTVAQARLERDLRFKSLAWINTISYAVGYGAVGVTLAALGGGVWALVMAQLTQAILCTSILLAWVRGSTGLSFEIAEARRLLRYGAGFSLTMVGNHVAVQLDNVIVGRWLGAQALGVYGRAYQLLVTPANLVGGVLDRVLFPAMASVQEHQNRLATAYLRAMAVTSFVILPLSGFLVSAAPEIVMLVLGPQWTEAVLPFRVLVGALLFRTGYKLSDTIVHARGAVYQSAWRKWLYAGSVAAGALIGQVWGLGGVAAGVGAAILTHYFVMLSLGLRLAGVSWDRYFRVQTPYWAIALLALISAWFTSGAARANGLHPATLLLVVLAATILPLLIVLASVGDRMGAEFDWMLTSVKRFSSDLFSGLRRRTRDG